MKSIIVGGGKIGYNLFKILKERDHQVTLIERDKETCLNIAEDINTDVIWGDGTELEVLRDAGIEEAEIVAAVTGSDEENLVICKIAKLSFETKRTIARVNNPKNTKMFKKLGIDNTVCSTEVIANLIEYSLDTDDYRIINTLEKGAMLLVELSMKEYCCWCDQYLRDLVLPQECVFVSVLRGEQIIYPRGATKILHNDKVLIITNKNALTFLVNAIFSKGNRKWKTRKMKSEV
ncbi:potassium channel family protein [Anaerosacchariphilus polymeriproducens]|uniref:Trk system potassium uptake protein TrkA n=1 Tax=Anaerosacchariphilus polymeriproducens TaxID=1812858 RepID=A0A371AZ03_9FIRM|nr:NAD-binding protein [Anaerosacchariphilus polymeriproducens]RDU24732.1 TrkA family potassium uptake protein [Anaerosacchariphilus polymeriproducens]